MDIVIEGGVISVCGLSIYLFYEHHRSSKAGRQERARLEAEAERRRVEDEQRMVRQRAAEEEDRKARRKLEEERRVAMMNAEVEDRERRRKAEEASRVRQKKTFQVNLIQEFGYTRAVDFPFEEFVARSGVDLRIATEVADEIFVDFARKAISDGKLTAEKRLKLDALAKGLRIAPARAQAVEREEKIAVYRKAVTDVLAGGVVTAAESVELESLRQSLGIDRYDVARVAEAMSGDAYIALLRRIVDSGEVDTSSLLELDRFKRAFALTNLGIARMVRDRAQELYREAFAGIVQDGVVTPDQESLLNWLQGEIFLPDDAIGPYLDQLAEAKRLARYRSGGELPSVQTRKLLEGGEICHWEGRCEYHYETTTRQVQAVGELVVSSKRVRFFSSKRNFSFAPWRLFDIEIQGPALSIQAEGSQGTGVYLADQPRVLEAILVGLARRGKYTASDGYASSASRHIPSDVKRKVWARDGGRCVRCNANQYLEYDHDIPHSKGGANSVENIRLLCRGCNSLKGDRI